jgi:lysine 2,3-aminomutase
MENLYRRFNLTAEEIKNIETVKRVYPMKISSYYLGLIKQKNDAIWKQCIPDIAELNDNVNFEDPLHEEKFSPVPFLVHRYPDRVLLLVSNRCAMYCRFCTRKRKVGKLANITEAHILNAINYIRDHHEIRDVIVSGGDPLMLANSQIEFVLKNLRAIAHVEIIRIGTRVPCTMPMRVTKQLVHSLKRYHPLFINVHFEHPDEITEESRRACELLADAGIPLGNQCVLLKGVNDNPETMKELFQKLLSMRVKPYYLYQADQVKGTEHFRTTIQEGLDIFEKIQGFTSGMCVPHYVVDIQGGGKVPVLPEYVEFKNDDRIILRNFEGRIAEYDNPIRETIRQVPDNFKIAVVFNMKPKHDSRVPKDFFAEFDHISVPMAIREALRKHGYDTDIVEADRQLYEKLASGSYSFVFNIAEGINGGARESQVPAILDMLNIPYTGSGVLTQAITLDKTKTKEILLYHGIATPKYQLFKSAKDCLNMTLQFPLIVKPNAEGSSKGIRNNSLVFNERELRRMVDFVLVNYKQPALVEEYLQGREFTVSVIGNNPQRVLPIVEVTFDYLPEHMHRFDSYDVKWIWDNPDNPVDPVVCPANIPKGMENHIKKVALRTSSVLGCVDLCRIDIRLDNESIPNVLDVNALPGLMPDPLENSRFPKSCFAASMTYDDIIVTIFNEAMKRYGMLRQGSNAKRKRSLGKGQAKKVKMLMA